jgi:hypothetical protein
MGATVYATPALLAADPGPTSTPRYAYVVSLDKHFSWNLYSTDTTNNVTIIGTNGNGAVGVWRVISGDDSGANLAATTPQTLTVSGGRLRVILLGTLTANMTLYLSTTGAQTDDEIEVVCNDTAAYTVTIVNGGPGGGNIAVKPVSVRGWIRSKLDGTNWYHAGSGQCFASA